MAEVIVFDHPVFHQEINEVLELGHHEVVAKATDVDQAFSVLHRLADQKLRADVLIMPLLLPSKGGTQVFEHLHRGEVEEHMIPGRLFGRRTIEAPRVTKVEFPASFALDSLLVARPIVEVLSKCGIDIKTIGNGADWVRADIAVDADISHYTGMLNLAIDMVTSGEPHPRRIID